MGLFDFFGKNGSDVKFLKKQADRALDKRAQPVDRMQALDELKQTAEEAILILLRRFDFQYDKSIDDEKEKQFAFETLVSFGKGVVPALRMYVKQAQSLSWPLKILGEVGDAEVLRMVMAEVCAANDNQYVRDPSKKIQLVSFLGEQVHVGVGAFLLPYLQDADEGVRFAAVEALLKQENRTELLDPLLTRLLATEETSKRLKMAIVEGCARMRLSVGAYAAEVAVVLDKLVPGAKLDGHKCIVLSKG